MGTFEYIASVMGCMIVAYVVGLFAGVRNERRRVEDLCHQAILQRGSGSVRRVWNAVSSGKTYLMSEDEFFGPETIPGKLDRKSKSDPHTESHEPGSKS